MKDFTEGIIIEDEDILVIVIHKKVYGDISNREALERAIELVKNEVYA